VDQEQVKLVQAEPGHGLERAGRSSGAWLPLASLLVTYTSSMPTVHTPVPVVPLRDGTGIPQIGFGTLSVQPSRDASQANIDVSGYGWRRALMARRSSMAR
jgi:hypothetical protein